MFYTAIILCILNHIPFLQIIVPCAATRTFLGECVHRRATIATAQRNAANIFQPMFNLGAFEADFFGNLTAFYLAAGVIYLADKDFYFNYIAVAGDCGVVNKIKIKHIARLVALKIVFL